VRLTRIPKLGTRTVETRTRAKTSLRLSGSRMALTYSGGCAEYRLFPLVVFEPFRLRNGVYVFRGLRGVPLTPGYYL
jgi:hypothetical protein